MFYVNVEYIILHVSIIIKKNLYVLKVLWDKIVFKLFKKLRFDVIYYSYILQDLFYKKFFIFLLLITQKLLILDISVKKIELK